MNVKQGCETWAGKLVSYFCDFCVGILGAMNLMCDTFIGALDTLVTVEQFPNLVLDEYACGEVIRDV